MPYRRKIVDRNLAACFPELSVADRRSIRRRFYRRFLGMIGQTLRLPFLSDKAMRRRVSWEGLDIIADLWARGLDIAVYFSHSFNWEWAPSIALHRDALTGLLPPGTPVRFCQVYRPLRARWADRLMLAIRSRFGTTSIPKANTLRALIKMRRQGIRTITGFMSDQHPSHGDPGHPTILLGQPTIMISGTETLARRLGMAVVYWDIQRIRRGRYRITTHLITDDPASLPPGEITERYTRLLEQTIRRDPPNWLWTHNRWKSPPHGGAAT